MRARVCNALVSDYSKKTAASHAHLRQLLVHIVNAEVSKAQLLEASHTVRAMASARCILCDEEALQNRRKTACLAVRLTLQCSYAPSNLTPHGNARNGKCKWHAVHDGFNRETENRFRGCLAPLVVRQDIRWEDLERITFEVVKSKN
jgi:hypothetical protein